MIIPRQNVLRVIGFAIVVLLAATLGCKTDNSPPNHEWFIFSSDNLSQEVTERFCQEVRTLVLDELPAGDIVHVVSLRGHLPLATISVKDTTAEERLRYDDIRQQLDDIDVYLLSGVFLEGCEDCGLDLDIIPATVAECRQTNHPARVILIGTAQAHRSYGIGCRCPAPRHSLKDEIAAERFHPELVGNFGEERW